MNFDDKFMGIINILGGLKSNGNNAPNMEGLAPILGLISSMGGGGKGVDLMKILPLMTALRGGSPLGGVTAQRTQNDADVRQSSKGYKDKYGAIAFAGNEVIYALGKLWKVRAT